MAKVIKYSPIVCVRLFDLGFEDYEASTAKNVQDQEQDCFVDCEADQRVHVVHEIG